MTEQEQIGEDDLKELEEEASTLAVSDEIVIRIREMHKWYGSFHVLKNINLEVNRGERIVICGPSGSGKSTMIRCINRLEEHQQGDIIVDDVELTNDLKNIDAIRREVGMVFQHFNLFPHLTVLENCSLAPIWVRKTPKAEAEETPPPTQGGGWSKLREGHEAIRDLRQRSGISPPAALDGESDR